MNERSLPPQSQHDAGLWCEISSGDFVNRAALFVDRDGVLVEDTHYLGRAEDVRILPGAAAAVARCNRFGVPIVIISNQSGIARGFYGWDGFCAVQEKLGAALAEAGGHVDAVLACAYHADGRPPFAVTDHPWRKPNPGMIMAAGQHMRLDLPRSWIVGDRAGDLEAGRNAGLAGGILLSLPSVRNAELVAARALGADTFIVETAATLAEAVSALTSPHRLAAAAPRK
jgi:D-glycero-D-manno-heptose 1,7-bisphosphate phosphatase